MCVGEETTTRTSSCGSREEIQLHRGCVGQDRTSSKDYAIEPVHRAIFQRNIGRCQERRNRQINSIGVRGAVDEARVSYFET